MIVSFLASMLTSPVWTAIWLSNTEIYPTAIRFVTTVFLLCFYVCNDIYFRNVSLGCTSMFNRLGGILAPQILFLVFIYLLLLNVLVVGVVSSIYFQAGQWPPLAYVIFAVLAIISCILYALFIPETKNRSLPHLTKL